MCAHVCVVAALVGLIFVNANSMDMGMPHNIQTQR